MDIHQRAHRSLIFLHYGSGKRRGQTINASYFLWQLGHLSFQESPLRSERHI